MASSSKKRKLLPHQSREMVCSVYHFLKEEFEFTKLYREPNCDISHLRDITKRTAEATTVSERTVQKILKEEREGVKNENDIGEPPSRLPKPRVRRKRENKIDLYTLSAGVVRSTIYDFYTLQKQIPTLAKLNSVLNLTIGFDGCLGTLRRLLLRLGYRWHKNENKRKFLVERHDIQLWRLQYLKKIAEYRCEGRPIVYTGESFVLKTHVQDNSWAEKEDSSLTKKNKPGRFIVVHAGTDAGFIDNACLILKLSSINEDCKFKMNFEKYIEWVNEKLLPNAPDRSVIVIDNAAHHNERTEKLPTANSDKSEMQQWLNSKGIQFDSNLHKIELYDIIKKHKSDFIEYKIDKYIKNKGFEVLRLPPYHPELNAIENIWGVIKNDIAIKSEHNLTGWQLLNESIARITSETWRNACTSVIGAETEYMKYFDIHLELIKDLQDGSDDESESEEEPYSQYDST